MKNENKNQITYRKEGDYLIPNLSLPPTDYPNYILGKYGRLRLQFLKENKPIIYQEMLLNNTLRKHIVETDMKAKKQVEELITSFKKHSNLTENMKDTDPLYWVGMMNNFKNQAEEIVFKELIYV